jgi:hypothetical protein
MGFFSGGENFVDLESLKKISILSQCLPCEKFFEIPNFLATRFVRLVLAGISCNKCLNIINIMQCTFMDRTYMKHQTCEVLINNVSKYCNSKIPFFMSPIFATANTCCKHLTPYLQYKLLLIQQYI